MRWMQVNLAVLTFVTTAVTALASTLVAGVWRVSEVSHEIAGLKGEISDIRLSIHGLHNDMVSADGRLNAGVVAVAALQRSCEAGDAQLQQRIAVSEAKLTFVTDRLLLPVPGSNGKSR